MKVSRLGKLLGLSYKGCTAASVTFINPVSSERVVVLLTEEGFHLSTDNSSHTSITEMVTHYRSLKLQEV